MTRARMLGRYRPLCLICRTEAGPDCTGKAGSRRSQRRIEKQRWHREAAQERNLR